MTHFKLLFISLAFLSSVVANASSPIEGDKSAGWTITTNSAAYRIRVGGDGAVKQTWFGGIGQISQPSPSNVIDEIPTRSSNPVFRPIVETIFSDGVRDIELEFVTSEVKEIDGCQTLVITQKDKAYPLTVTSYIRVIPEHDVFEKWLEVRNDGKKSIKVENLMSGSFFLPADDYKLQTVNGTGYNDFMIEESRLNTGTHTIEVRNFKSHGIPYFSLRPERDDDFTSGPVWFGMLNYSGNWKMDFTKRFASTVQVTGGVNFWDTEWELKAGTTRETPRMVIGFCREGQEGASQRLAAYTRDQLLPAQRRDRPRPVLYNSWYATFYNVTAAHQIELAKLAKQIGVEIFCIDDGWFKGRTDHLRGLGDWTVDQNKFPNGLDELISEVNGLGMDFGIWVEPEMTTTHSDIYKKHPEWAFHSPNRPLSEGRVQLNLAREDVYQYILGSMSDLLSTYNIKFVKWDHNRPLIRPDWPGQSRERQREVRLLYMDNFYRLIDELTTRFPDVWFENCSSGGGRVDGGLFGLMDMAWASDNSDAVARQFIQYGYLSVFPASTMIGWVTREDQQKLGLSMEYKFDVSMQGVLGMGEDLQKLDAAQLEVARNKIALYKEIRETIHNGTLYRLLSPFEGERTALEYVNPDKTQAVLMLYNRGDEINLTSMEKSRSNLLVLRGLNPEAHYSVEGMKQAFKGEYLMEVGFPWPVKGAYKSIIIRLERVSAP